MTATSLTPPSSMADEGGVRDVAVIESFPENRCRGATRSICRQAVHPVPGEAG